MAKKQTKATHKITEDMPITYDIEADYLYKKGIEKGIEKESKRGMEEKVEIICNARLEGASIDFISKIVKLPPARVREILNSKGIA